MKDKIFLLKEKIKNNLYIIGPLAFCFVFFLTISFLLTIKPFGDDEWVPQIIDKYGLWNWVSDRLTNYTGRVGTEILGPILIRYPSLYLVLTSLISIILFYSILKIFKQTNIWVNFLLCLTFLFFFFINPYLYYSAGYMATTFTYFWPICLLSYIIYIILKVNDTKEQPNLYQWIVTILSLVTIILWVETIAIFACLFFVLTYIYQYYKNKKSNTYLLTLSIIACVFVIYAAVYPGNKKRIKETIESYYPAYAGFSFFQKIELGFICFYRFSCMQIYMLVFTFIALIYSITHKISTLNRINLAIMLVEEFALSTLFSEMIRARSVDLDNFFEKHLNNPSLIGFFLSLVFVVQIATLFIELTKKNHSNHRSMFLIIAGSASIFTLGFTPAVWVTGYRACLAEVYGVFLITSQFFIDGFIEKLEIHHK